VQFNREGSGWKYVDPIFFNFDAIPPIRLFNFAHPHLPCLCICSYKYAEVLSADCYGAFEEAGLDDDAAVVSIGRKFR
jgi:hypothetical protein